MNEILVTVIAIGSVVILCLMTWGITSFVYWCIDRHDRKKWNTTVAQYPEVLDYQNEANMWWKEYEKKS